MSSCGLKIVLIAFVNLVAQNCVCSKSPTENSMLENLSLRFSGSCVDSAEEGSFILGVLSVWGQCCSWINFQTAFATLVCCIFVVTDAQQAFVLRYLFIVL